MSNIRKRRVFYLSGFDPRGVAAYHRLFAEEAEKQGTREGLIVEVGARERLSPLSSIWRARRPPGEGAVETTFEFLHWDDIVRAHWRSGYGALYRIAPAVYWRGIRTTGLLAKVFRVCKWCFVTGLAPLSLLVLFPLLALLAGWLVWGAVQAAYAGAAWPAALAGVAAATLVIALGVWLERTFSLGWLLRTYAFVLNHGEGRLPELEARLDQFAQRIVDYVAASDDDEIVFVGHSVGANIAVSALARALARDPGLWRRRPAALLTLGGTMPMQALIPDAAEFRRELAAIAESHDLDWVDISADEDAASFALVNPVAASGVSVDPQAAHRPQVLCGDFKTMLTPGNYYRAVWNLFRMHFQYLMATERELLHDYLSVTTGSLSFRQRFGRKLQS